MRRSSARNSRTVAAEQLQVRTSTGFERSNARHLGRNSPRPTGGDSRCLVDHRVVERLKVGVQSAPCQRTP